MLTLYAQGGQPTLPNSTDSLQSINDSVFHRQIVVIDAETFIPIGGVTVRVDDKLPAMTDYLGRVELTERFEKIAFSHINYDAEQLSFIELADTMLLFPRHNMLDEVVVTGINPDLKRAMKTAHDNMLAQPVMQGLTFDFGLLLDKRARRDRKHLKKAKEIIREWDMMPIYREKETLSESKEDKKEKPSR